ncbi:DNA/RNA helicase domain-containing protein [Fructilactobacillus sp. Tb1]|uniref:DNA/RNA helicase domain-containing protein n=1 Tax=Fructilactobacillus sp. Tb1 TaxID=3422304 RepID=UPI003D26D0D3
MDKHVSRFINIKSILDIINTGNNDLLKSLFNSYDNSFSKKTNKQRNIIKDSEKNDLSKLIKLIVNNGISPMFDGYLLNYTFYNGIREEFDILRFGSENVLNIELKREKPKEDIKNQLIRHKRLLNLMNNDSSQIKAINLFTYVSSSNTIWKLNNKNELQVSNINELINCIDEKWIRYNPLNDLDMTNLIISPYSEPEKFIQHKYFLTSNQAKISKEISNCKSHSICLTGGPGSGKTLVLFDYAKKETSKGKKVLFIICSPLKSSEDAHLSSILGLDVKSIKNAFPYNPGNRRNYNYLSKYDVIIIDEAQRIYESQLNIILSIENSKKIFSCDQRQTFHPRENKLNVTKILNDNGSIVFKLSEKIRSDPAMSSFIQKFLNLRVKKIQPFDYENVDAIFFDNIDEARKYMQYMESLYNFQIIELTEYRTKSSNILKRKNIMDSSISTHESIGKEFDNVIIPIDQYFEYDNNAKLSSTYGYYPYNEDRLVFEGLTRVRKRLLLVVIDNPKIFKTILEILSWKNDKLLEQ